MSMKSVGRDCRHVARRGGGEEDGGEPQFLAETMNAESTYEVLVDRMSLGNGEGPGTIGSKRLVLRGKGACLPDA
jgi:hypothetical protein